MSGRDLLDGLPADAKARLRKRAQPKWVAPMLATLTDEVFSRQGWLFEPKWDGERCLAFRRGRDLDLFSRNRIRLNAKYPEVVEAIHRQETASFIADGEIVTFEGAITSFAKLQARMQVRHPSADLIRKVPVWFYLFDLLYLDRYDIRQVPLRYRKQVLRNAIGFQGSLRLMEHRETEGEDYYRKACEKGWEGIIAKNGDSVYVSGRTRDWLKFKCKQQENNKSSSLEVTPIHKEVAAGSERCCWVTTAGVSSYMPARSERGSTRTCCGVWARSSHGWRRRFRLLPRTGCRDAASLGETETRRSNRIHRVDGGRQATTPSSPRPAG
jgi:ATP-dependent DNA ligase